MAQNHTLFEDLARMAGGAAQVAAGMKNEMEGLVRRLIEKKMNRLNLVPREEFELVRDMAHKARLAQEQLEKRVAVLEKKLGAAKTRKAAKKK